jgi:hypothetical protein
MAIVRLVPLYYVNSLPALPVLCVPQVTILLYLAGKISGRTGTPNAMQ